MSSHHLDHRVLPKLDGKSVVIVCAAMYTAAIDAVLLDELVTREHRRRAPQVGGSTDTGSSGSNTSARRGSPRPSAILE